jgi:PTH1 family peptidyl-tRNA hydrolase
LRFGKPGPKYEETRHNAGFMALDALAEQEKVKINRLKFKALYGEMPFPAGGHSC